MPIKRPREEVRAEEEDVRLLLPKAVRNGDATEVKRLLDAKADPNARCEDELLPIIRASSNLHPSHVEIVELLLHNKADANKSDNGHSAIIDAVRSRKPSIDIVRLLLDSKVDPNTANIEDELPLTEALGNIYIQRHSCIIHEIVKLLLQRNADANAKDSSHNNPLVRAIEAMRGKDTVGLLLNYGADPNRTSRSGHLYQLVTPFRQAVKTKQLDVIGVLLEHGVHLKTCLPVVIAERNAEATELVLERGANPNEEDRLGNIPIRMSMSLDVAEVLIRSEEAVNAVQNDPEVLISAITNRDVGVVSLFLKAGAKVNAKNELGRLPIMVAIQMTNPNIAHGMTDVLLNHGAELSIQDDTVMKTPMIAAVQLGILGIVKRLVEHGGVAILTTYGLVEAVKSNHADVARYLIQQGVDPNLCYDSDGIPLLLVAAKKYSDYSDYSCMMDLLIKKADPTRQNDTTGKLIIYELFPLCIKNGDMSTVDHLIYYYPGHVNINAPSTIDGKYPLVIAAETGRVTNVKYLVDILGADPAVVDNQGEHVVLREVFALGHIAINILMLPYITDKSVLLEFFKQLDDPSIPAVIANLESAVHLIDPSNVFNIEFLKELIGANPSVIAPITEHMAGKKRIVVQMLLPHAIRHLTTQPGNGLDVVLNNMRGLLSIPYGADLFHLHPHWCIYSDIIDALRDTLRAAIGGTVCAPVKFNRHQRVELQRIVAVFMWKWYSFDREYTQTRGGIGRAPSSWDTVVQDFDRIVPQSSWVDVVHLPRVQTRGSYINVSEVPYVSQQKLIEFMLVDALESKLLTTPPTNLVGFITACLMYSRHYDEIANPLLRYVSHKGVPGAFGAVYERIIANHEHNAKLSTAGILSNVKSKSVRQYIQLSEEVSRSYQKPSVKDAIPSMMDAFQKDGIKLKCGIRTRRGVKTAGLSEEIVRKHIAAGNAGDRIHPGQLISTTTNSDVGDSFGPVRQTIIIPGCPGCEGCIGGSAKTVTCPAVRIAWVAAHSQFDENEVLIVDEVYLYCIDAIEQSYIAIKTESGWGDIPAPDFDEVAFHLLAVEGELSTLNVTNATTRNSLASEGFTRMMQKVSLGTLRERMLLPPFSDPKWWKHQESPAASQIFEETKRVMRDLMNPRMIIPVTYDLEEDQVFREDKCQFQKCRFNAFKSLVYLQERLGVKPNLYGFQTYTPMMPNALQHLPGSGIYMLRPSEPLADNIDITDLFADAPNKDIAACMGVISNAGGRAAILTCWDMRVYGEMEKWKILNIGDHPLFIALTNKGFIIVNAKEKEDTATTQEEIKQTILEWYQESSNRTYQIVCVGNFHHSMRRGLEIHKNRRLDLLAPPPNLDVITCCYERDGQYSRSPNVVMSNLKTQFTSRITPDGDLTMSMPSKIQIGRSLHEPLLCILSK